MDHALEFDAVTPTARATVAADTTIEWKKTHVGASQVYLDNGSRTPQIIVTSETKLTRDRLRKLGLSYLPSGASTGYTVRTADKLSPDSALEGVPIELPTAPWLSVFFQTS